MAVKTLRELALFAFYLIVAIVLTWPLASNLSTAVSDLGDPLLNAWILDWDCYALTHQPLHLFDAPIFYPAKYPLAYSEHLVGVALLVLPFWLAGLGAVTIHNIAILLGFALSAYGASVLARVVTNRFLPSALAGGALAAVLSQNGASAGVPATVVSSTIKVANLFAAGKATGMLSIAVARLTEGVLKTMLLSKIKIAVVACLVIASLQIGVSALTRETAAADPAPRAAGP